MNKLSKAMAKAGYTIRSKSRIVGLKIKKHKSKILVVSGIVGGSLTIILTAVQSFKAKKYIDDTKLKIQAIYDDENYKANDEERKKAVTKLYFKLAKDLLKVYGPVILLGFASVVSGFCGVKSYEEENAALASEAMSAVNALYGLKERIKERFGEETAQELIDGVEKKEIEVKEINPDTGEIETKKEKINVIVDAPLDPDAIIFNDDFGNYSRSRKSNQIYLDLIRSSLQNQLEAKKGVLLASDMLKELCYKGDDGYGTLPKWAYTKGWIWNRKDREKQDMIDFRIEEAVISELDEFAEDVTKIVFILHPNWRDNVIDLL